MSPVWCKVFFHLCFFPMLPSETFSLVKDANSWLIAVWEMSHTLRQQWVSFLWGYNPALLLRAACHATLPWVHFMCSGCKSLSSFIYCFSENSVAPVLCRAPGLAITEYLWNLVQTTNSQILKSCIYAQKRKVGEKSKCNYSVTWIHLMCSSGERQIMKFVWWLCFSVFGILIWVLFQFRTGGLLGDVHPSWGSHPSKPPVVVLRSCALCPSWASLVLTSLGLLQGYQCNTDAVITQKVLRFWQTLLQQFKMFIHQNLYFH